MRLFLALPIPSPLAAELALRAHRALAADHPRARLYAAADLHLTLRFFGTLAPARLPELHAALAPLTHAPFSLTLPGVGVFRDAGVVFAAVAPSPSLAALAEAVNEALAWRGFPRELRPFHPHITLARQRHGLAQPALDRWQTSWQPISFTADRLALFESIPAGATPDDPALPPTARYRILQQFPLAPRSPELPPCI